jgi:hypothetical protein
MSVVFVELNLYAKGHTCMVTAWLSSVTAFSLR